MILTKSYLSAKSSAFHADSEAQQDKIFTENNSLKFTRKHFDLFVSHSYLDKKLIIALVKLFNDAGYSVYVDWIHDRQLDRSSVDCMTANTLRLRMVDCSGLAYIATSNATNSKWCPWELGYVDGNKNGRCAILPILETSCDMFSGQEYLGLYPFIDYSTNLATGKSDFWVNSQQDKSKRVSLRSWLLGKDPQ